MINIGDGVTIAVGSDMGPFTVIGFTKSQKTVTVQGDDWKIVSGSFQTNDAVIEYTRNPNGEIRVIRFSKRFNRYQVHQYMPAYIGSRRYYRDPHK
jgi:hypothetical protein